MKLTKQRKIYIFAVSLTGVWLVTDRVISSQPAIGPARASANLIVPEDAAAEQAELAPPASVAAGVSMAQLLDRIPDRTDRSGPLRDVFKPPASWLHQPKPTLEQVPQQEEVMEDFADQHRLEAVVPTQQLAMVDGRILKVGQKLAGFTLVAVEARSTVFQKENVRVRLSMDGAAGVGKHR